MIDRTIVIIVGVAALIAGALLLAAMFTPSPPPGSGWRITANHPVVVGGYGDNFQYSGKDVRPVGGDVALVFDPKTHTGTIVGTVSTTAASGALWIAAATKLTGRITLSARITPADRVVTNADIYGDTGFGGPNLPTTHALIAGAGTFDLYVNGKLVYTGLRGEWSVADAVRKPDGSIRQSGLVYSPLLRDKTGFSDPHRREFTLIVHSTAADPNNNPPYTVALQIVFTAVTVNHRPAG